jgi:hypothetical protein
VNERLQIRVRNVCENEVNCERKISIKSLQCLELRNRIAVIQMCCLLGPLQPDYFQIPERCKIPLRTPFRSASTESCPVSLFQATGCVPPATKGMVSGASRGAKGNCRSRRLTRSRQLSAEAPASHGMKAARKTSASTEDGKGDH